MEIKVPSHMKLVTYRRGGYCNDKMLVPIEFNEKQSLAYIYMCNSGYNCNASKEGFSDFVKGNNENPFSVTNDIVRAMRWCEGHNRAKKASA